MFKMKRLMSLILVGAMTISTSISAFAMETKYNEVEEIATVVVDNQDKRVAVYDDVTATYDKDSNTMTVVDGKETYSFSLDTQNDGSYSTMANRVIKQESVALHAYQYIKTDSGSYYYGVDIPSYSINPFNWCGWISVWDDGSVEGNFAKEFAGYIEDAQDDEHTLAAYGGATLVAAVVGLVSKNPNWSATTFKAVCAAAGILVTVGVLDAGASYFSNLTNARQNYFAIREILG